MDTSAADFLPAARTLKALRAAAADCRGCPLYARGTQTVFGEGPRRAALVLVGEQPGDEEDRVGRPFVGPAGAVLARVLEEVGIDRAAVYVTNAVKHFKWEPRGSRRLHKKPSAREIAACHPWLAEEVRAVRPRMVVCLGLTAARAAFGRAVRLKDVRAQFTVTPLSAATFVTTHPAALLRVRGGEARAQAHAQFRQDLADVAARLAQ
ncbi:UdgX family uracil-DNA binding protein [Ectothiorhodospiraceae bacterium 2226]|nr:UdgX family uracil-DNA binding protein [Ectothiorhodospiraceae bacterium 2226]